MRLLWTLLKIVVALCLVIPVSIIVMATVLGLFGAFLGLAILTLRLAVAGLVVFGLFKLATTLFGGSRSRPRPVEVKPLPPIDPYYAAAKRELDRELGEAR